MSKSDNTFKGVLDFLIIPLVARQLWNWSFLQEQNNNISLSMDLAISAARTFSTAVSLARIVMGIALTITLTPLVGVICLLRPMIKPTRALDAVPLGGVSPLKTDNASFTN